MKFIKFDNNYVRLNQITRIECAHIKSSKKPYRFRIFLDPYHSFLSMNFFTEFERSVVLEPFLNQLEEASA